MARHEFSTAADFFAAVEVFDLVALIRVEAAQFYGQGFTSGIETAEGLHHAFAEVGAVELPRDPRSRVEAVGRQRVVVAGVERADLEVAVEMLPQRGDSFRIAVVDGETAARAHAAAQGEIVGGGGTEPVQRQPVRKAVSHGLDILREGFVAPGVVAAPEHDAAAHHLEVETSASCSAVVENQIGMTTGQFVEKSVEAVDVADLAQADFIRFLVGVPEIGRVKIEILPVKIEARAGDLFRDGFDGPLARLGIAKIEEEKSVPLLIAQSFRCVRRFQQPVGMLALQRGAAHGSLRFEPGEKAHPRLAHRRAHRCEPVREADRIGLGIALTFGKAAFVPAGIEVIAVER